MAKKPKYDTFSDEMLRDQYRKCNNLYAGLSSGDILVGFAAALEEAVDQGVLNIKQAGDIMERAAKITETLSNRGWNQDVIETLFGPGGINVKVDQ